MAQSPDHPDLVFIQAKKYAKGRPDGPPLWIVVHDMEASETSTRAENTANYFATLPDGRSVSSHYCADNNSIVQCVKLADTAYTVGNRQGNYRGINWEFAGFASQTREQWLDPYGKAMFALAAPYIRADAARFGIPLVRRTVSELKAMIPGITSHNDLRLAFGTTTHTDPGPNFPWDYFMDLIQEDDMTPIQQAQLTNIETFLWQGMINGWDRVTVPFPGDDPNATPIEVDNVLMKIINQIAAATGLTPEELEQVKAAAREGAAEAPQGPLSDEDLAKIGDVTFEAVQRAEDS